MNIGEAPRFLKADSGKRLATAIDVGTPRQYLKISLELPTARVVEGEEQ
jgi:hypothetical protein